MKTSIALIGFMGAGKTAVGKTLAEKLDREFVELVSLIEHKAGKSIPDVFQQDGEIAFRELEIEATKEVSRAKNLVIGCGGGLVLNQINIDRLKQEARIVYLTTSLRVMLKHALSGGEERPVLKRTLSGGEERPVLKVADKAWTIQELLRLRKLLSFREPFYERAADIKIDTSKLDVEAVVEQIIEKLEEDEGFHL